MSLTSLQFETFNRAANTVLNHSSPGNFSDVPAGELVCKPAAAAQAGKGIEASVMELEPVLDKRRLIHIDAEMRRQLGQQIRAANKTSVKLKIKHNRILDAIEVGIWDDHRAEQKERFFNRNEAGRFAWETIRQWTNGVLIELIAIG